MHISRRYMKLRHYRPCLARWRFCNFVTTDCRTYEAIIMYWGGHKWYKVHNIFSWKSFRCWKCEHWHMHSDSVGLTIARFPFEGGMQAKYTSVLWSSVEECIFKFSKNAPSIFRVEFCDYRQTDRHYHLFRLI